MDLKKRAKYLVVISLDGLASADIELIKELPHFKQILESGSYVREVKGIYPTQTYPLHASIITGTYPQKHGIIANTRKEPGIENPEWFWFRKDIKVPTLYDIARSAKLKVGSDVESGPGQCMWMLRPGVRLEREEDERIQKSLD